MAAALLRLALPLACLLFWFTAGAGAVGRCAPIPKGSHDTDSYMDAVRDNIAACKKAVSRLTRKKRLKSSK